MDDATRQKLLRVGRDDLVKVHDLTVSGWAGINSTGGAIVDRRKYPQAIPLPRTSVMPSIPEPKELTYDDLSLECKECDYMLNYEPERSWPKNCAKCQMDTDILRRFL